MAKTTTANFNTENAKLNRKPVFILEFDSLTRKYSTGTFGNISGDHKTLIDSVAMSSTELDIVENNIRPGSAQFVIVDEGLDVSDLIVQNNLNKKGVTIKFGFQALNDTDFLSFDGWAITDIQPNPDKVSYIFTCEDAGRFFSRNVGDFIQTTNLNGAYDATGGLDIVTDSTTGFIDPTNIPSEIAEYIDVGVIFNNEIFMYDGITATDFQNPSRIVWGGVPINTAHEDDSEVKQVVVFHEYDAVTLQPTTPLPMKCYLHVLLTSDDGSGHAYYDLATYDSGFKGMGLGYVEADVNIKEIENVGHLIVFNTVEDGGNSGAVYRLEPAAGFLSRFFWRPLGVFHYIDSDGKVSIKTFDSVEFDTGFSSVNTFDDDSIVDFDYKIEWDDILNTIVFRYDNNLKGSPVEVDKYKIDESVTDYGQGEKIFELESGWTPSNATANFILNNFLRRWFYSFANPFARSMFESLTSDIIWDPGDLVDFTLTDEVDLTGASAARGITTKKGVLSRQDVSLVGRGDDDPDFSVKYAALLLDIFDKVSGFVTDVTVDEATFEAGESGSGGRKALVFEAVNDNVLHANDAYTDFASTKSAQAFKVTIEITPPGSGTDEHNLFAIGIHVQSPAATDTFAAVAHPAVRYHSTESTAYEVSFYVVNEGGNVSMDRFKVDLFDLRETDNAAVGAGETPTFKITELIYGTLNKTISTL